MIERSSSRKRNSVYLGTVGAGPKKKVRFVTPEKPTSGLGQSILSRPPFEEESDNDEVNTPVPTPNTPNPQSLPRPTSEITSVRVIPRQEQVQADNNIRTPSPDEVKHVDSLVYKLEQEQEKARKQFQQQENIRKQAQHQAKYNSPSRGIEEPITFVKNRHLLQSLRAPATPTKQPRKPSTFQEDLDNPPESASQLSNAPLLTPVPTYSSAVSTSVAWADLTALGFTEEHVKNFEPNDLDNKVWDYLHRKPPMEWATVKKILDYSGVVYVLETLKTRQLLLGAQLSLTKGKSQAQAETTPVRQPQPQPQIQPLQQTEVNNSQPSRPAKRTAAAPVPQPRPPQALGRVTDTKILADTLEQERLTWSIKAAESQQRIKALEEEAAASKLRIQEQEQQLQLKTEVVDKYQKLREEHQTQKESLKDERTQRKKAENDAKKAQNDLARRALAQAGSGRKHAKATNLGFALTLEEGDEEDETVQKKAPTKRRATKSTTNANLREGGHLTTAGKSLPPSAIQALYKHLGNCRDEDEAEEHMQPESIQEKDLIHFVYTVYRKQWLKGEQEPDDDDSDTLACGAYTHLNEANAEVTNEILRPHGTSIIRIDPLQDRTLHQGVGNYNMAWAQINVPAGSVKVWVERQLHTEYKGELPLFEARGLLSKIVFAVRQEISTADLETAPVIKEDEEIYTTFDLANNKASEKVFKMQWPDTQSLRMDDVLAREKANQARKEMLEDLEDNGKWFSEELSRDDGSKIKVFIVQKTVVGPRN
ncbi:hypothetical protein E4T47_00485 [Aureobasidium subglaciale]|nr:hypothetical protein E4T47_00485 [Aureobasidium subglaciale]